jgi:two-component system chemotaxis response regulator CheB
VWAAKELTMGREKTASASKPTLSESRGKHRSREALRPSTANQATRDLVVIGGSGGGIEAVTRVIRDIPATFPAAIAVVLHRSESGPNLLSQILGRVTKLKVADATNGIRLAPGCVFVPAIDHHLLVKDGGLVLSKGARENHVRPAVDPLFRSAAAEYGARAIAVVLSGALDDGTAGMMAIKRCGGTTVVQDPETAMFSGMPRSALENVRVDYRVHLDEIATLLMDLAGSPIDARAQRAIEVLKKKDAQRIDGYHPPGGDVVTGFVCPDCGGVLRESHEGSVPHFICHTGHQYGFESLVAGKEADVEMALWSAVRALNEKLTLTKRMADRARDRGHGKVTSRYVEQISLIEGQIRTLRELMNRL